jgi:hypothetical protein
MLSNFSFIVLGCLSGIKDPNFYTMIAMSTSTFNLLINSYIKNNIKIIFPPNGYIGESTFHVNRIMDVEDFYANNSNLLEIHRNGDFFDDIEFFGRPNVNFAQIDNIRDIMLSNFTNL